MDFYTDSVVKLTVHRKRLKYVSMGFKLREKMYTPSAILNLFPVRCKSWVKPSILALPMLDLSMKAHNQIPNSHGRMW